MPPLTFLSNWVCLWLGNSIWLAALSQYVYITYLGFAALPFIIRSELLLAPLLPVFVGYVLSVSTALLRLVSLPRLRQPCLIPACFYSSSSCSGSTCRKRCWRHTLARAKEVAEARIRLGLIDGAEGSLAIQVLPHIGSLLRARFEWRLVEGLPAIAG